MKAAVAGSHILQFKMIVNGHHKADYYYLDNDEVGSEDDELLMEEFSMGTSDNYSAKS